MINDTCNLQGKIEALLRRWEENWTVLGEGVGGPHSSLWILTRSVMLLCLVLQCLSRAKSLYTGFPSTSSVFSLSPVF